MKLIVPAALVAAIVGFVAVYASLTLRGNGELITEDTITEKSGHLNGQRLRAFIHHKTPKELPEFTFKDGSGNDVSLADFKGKVVVLNLWATWCLPCREEMPSLDNLKANFDEAAFDVVAISMDRGGAAKPRKFYDDIRLKSLDLYYDPTTKAMFKLKAIGLPATLLIDAMGREIGRLPGPAKWDSDAAFQIVKKALDQRGEN